MKKVLITLTASFVLLFAFSSCKKVAENIFQGLDVKVPDVNVTIPIIIAVTPNEISLGSFSFNYNLDSIVRANTGGVFGANAVNLIKIKQININITNADQLNNLANFQSARFTLHSNTNTTPIEFFSQTFPDTFASSFTFTPTNSAELLTYLKGSSITYTIYGKMRRITTKPLNLVISTTIGLK